VGGGGLSRKPAGGLSKAGMAALNPTVKQDDDISPPGLYGQDSKSKP